MLMTDIISKKRYNKELTQSELEFFVKSVTDGSLPEYQISAFLMAVCINGMTENETSALTMLMANSGDILDLSVLGDKTVDKHSTGGVGDKTTLICAPIAAAIGCTVAKMSGKGLGFTGGTADKLEAIDGYKTVVPNAEFLNLAKKSNISLISQSGNLTPADKKLYAIRDVTSTIESIPLIASSIMSKKIAAGARNILLDVKFGSGAFMKTQDDAEKLAIRMVKIGKSLGRNTAAVITDMDIPLGRCIGNTLEVEEACEILKGKGDKRLFELCIFLAANMHSLCFSTNIEESIKLAEKAILDGSALKKLCELVSNHGGDSRLITGEKSFKNAEHSISVTADKSGYISGINSETVGKASLLCGAGRETLNDKIDFSAGIILNKCYGEYAKKGETIATLYGKKQKLNSAKSLLETAFSFSSDMPPERKLIYKTITEV